MWVIDWNYAMWVPLCHLSWLARHETAGVLSRTDWQTDGRTVWSRAYDLTLAKAAQTLQTKVNCSSQSSCRWELKKRVETFSVPVSTVRDWRRLPARSAAGRDKTRRAPSRSAGWLNLENVIAFVDDDCAQTAYETRSLVSRGSLRTYPSAGRFQIAECRRMRLN